MTVFLCLFFVFVVCTKANLQWQNIPHQEGDVIVLQISQSATVYCAVSVERPTSVQLKSRRNSANAYVGKSILTDCLAGTICGIYVPMIETQDKVWCTANGLDIVEPAEGLVYEKEVEVEDNLAQDLDQFWLLFGSVLVFFMQIGFSMVEAGYCKTKNVSHILYINFVDCAISGLLFWACGWAFSFGGDQFPEHQKNGFIGMFEFFLFTEKGYLPRNKYMFWMFQWAFCSAAATIVSGAVAERTKIVAYVVFDSFISAWVYPVLVHWVWSNHGWLSPFAESSKRLGDNGMFDFAGSGVIHLCGGTCALVGCIFVGPRIGRFSSIQETKEEKLKRMENFQPHNKLLACMGVFFLWFGWYGFNCVSTGAISGGVSLVAGKVAVTTTLGSVGGILSAVILDTILNSGTFGLEPALNGSLIGLVAITSGCSVIEPWAAFLIGLIAGVLIVAATYLFEYLKIDDPVSAIHVHFVGGIWGCIAPGLFATKDNVLQSYSLDTGVYGLFYGGGGQQLGIQLLGALCIFTWTAFWCFVVFGVLKLTGQLRVNPETEQNGLDTTEHGGPAYDDMALIKQEVERRLSIKEISDTRPDAMETFSIRLDLEELPHAPDSTPHNNYTNAM